MARKYFGTDGVRGRVGEGVINPEFVMKLGWAAGRVLAREGRGGVVVGKDTRISGYMFESALEAGLSAAGLDCWLLGPMPTPGIAYLTHTLGAEAGIVISASHNAFEDNGIKFFSRDGTKLPDEVEQAIEASIDEPMDVAPPAKIGRARRISDAAGRYTEFCKSAIRRELDLRGLKIVVDCANGATYHIAPNVFRELGAEVIAMAHEPDGFNINRDCGSTHPQGLVKRVLSEGADLGIGFDGDGDRVVMVDAKGTLVDGDELIYIIARHNHLQGRWRGGVVGTLMSNLGLELGLKRYEIPFTRANVGDRYVMQQLRERGWYLGGENSGHIICLNCTTTGDGIISALQVLEALVSRQESLREALAEMHKCPQTLINVRLARQGDVTADPLVQQAVAEVESQLGERGRVLLRLSGTEPLVRVMVEGEDGAEVDRLCQQLAEQVRQAVGV